MNTSNIAELAQRMDRAALEAQPVPQLSLQDTFTVAEAYAIQAASLAHRYARGEQLSGVKMGFTSQAKMAQMGVSDMIFGRLTDAMAIPNGGSLSMKALIHPRVEPELCFLVREPIDRELTAADWSQYIAGVAPALEIIDSRYENFQFSLEDVIADNCSSAAFVVGEWQAAETPVSKLRIAMEINGYVVQTGDSDAILGDPHAAVFAASRLAAQYGQVIPAGACIMAGAATAAVFLTPGTTVRVHVDSLGEAHFDVVD